jgi:hypothetical protein
MQRTSAGLGRHCFASDGRFQPALLCGLFAAPSGFHNSFLSFQSAFFLEATATHGRALAVTPLSFFVCRLDKGKAHAYESLICFFTYAQTFRRM